MDPFLLFYPISPIDPCFECSESLGDATIDSIFLQTQELDSKYLKRLCKQINLDSHIEAELEFRLGRVDFTEANSMKESRPFQVKDPYNEILLNVEHCPFFRTTRFDQNSRSERRGFRSRFSPDFEELQLQMASEFFFRHLSECNNAARYANDARRALIDIINDPQYPKKSPIGDIARHTLALMQERECLAGFFEREFDLASLRQQKRSNSDADAQLDYNDSAAGCFITPFIREEYAGLREQTFIQNNYGISSDTSLRMHTFSRLVRRLARMTTNSKPANSDELREMFIQNRSRDDDSIFNYREREVDGVKFESTVKVNVATGDIVSTPHSQSGDTADIRYALSLEYTPKLRDEIVSIKSNKTSSFAERKRQSFQFAIYAALPNARIRAIMPFLFDEKRFEEGHSRAEDRFNIVGTDEKAEDVLRNMFDTGRLSKERYHTALKILEDYDKAKKASEALLIQKQNSRINTGSGKMSEEIAESISSNRDTDHNDYSDSDSSDDDSEENVETDIKEAEKIKRITSKNYLPVGPLKISVDFTSSYEEDSYNIEFELTDIIGTLINKKIYTHEEKNFILKMWFSRALNMCRIIAKIVQYNKADDISDFMCPYSKMYDEDQAIGAEDD